MILLFTAIALVVCFALLLKALRVVANSRKVIAVAHESVRDLRAADKTDAEKEAALQAHARQLFVLFLAIAAGSAAAVLIPYAGLWLLDRAALVPLDAVMAFTLSWQFISGSVLVILPFWWLARRRAR